MSKWIKYETEGNDYIPMIEWGRDHWSTFCYLETCAVDAKGVIDNRRMRCHARLHRGFVGILFSGINDASQYPTRAKKRDIPKHDDWSCLEDMVAAGLITSEWCIKDHNEVVGHLEGRVKFTEAGLAISGALRAHKARGGNFNNFDMFEAVAK